MSEYNTPVDVGNRALQMLGATRITALTDNSKNAGEINACYDKLRAQELRRNVWRSAIRSTPLRPLSESTMLAVPAAYDATKNYPKGALVSYSGKIYQAGGPAAVAVAPTNILVWTRYFGGLTAEPWDDDTSYFAGDLVYTPADETAKVYVSLENDNEDDPTDTPAYVAATVYRQGETVVSAATTYQSKTNLNVGHLPPNVTYWEAIPGTQPQRRYGRKWLALDLAFDDLAAVEIAYPAGSGPVENVGTRNIYVLPTGFLRMANQQPKAGSVNLLGASSAQVYRDWDIESNLLVTMDQGPIVLRFVANIDEVYSLDAMFCGGLAARIAVETCEVITQSDKKLRACGAMYDKFMGDARAINAIEIGSEEAAEDDFITCRR